MIREASLQFHLGTCYISDGCNISKLIRETAAGLGGGMQFGAGGKFAAMGFTDSSRSMGPGEGHLENE